MDRDTLGIINRYRQAIMGFAALWIWFFHIWSVVSKNGIGVSVEYSIKRIGFCGVDIFFFLSGMGLTYAISKNNIKTFYIRRIRRIIPAYIIMGILVGIDKSWDWLLIIKNITGYNFYIESIYSFLWFVPAILTLYILFPWYYRIAQKTGDIRAFIYITLVVWTIVSVFFRNDIREDLYGFTNRIPIFLFGVLFGNYIKTDDRRISKQKWALIVMMLVLGLYFSYIIPKQEYFLLVPESNCCIPNILMGISITLLLSKGFDSLVNSKAQAISKTLMCIFGFYGKMSFEFYLVQEWIGEKFDNVFSDVIPLLRNIILLIICSLAAWGVHLFMESIFERKKHKSMIY